MLNKLYLQSNALKSESSGKVIPYKVPWILNSDTFRTSANEIETSSKLF